MRVNNSLRLLLLSFFVLIFSFALLFHKSFSIKRDYTLIVENGSGLSKIAKKLAREKLIASEISFKTYARIFRIFNDCKNVQKGEYQFHQGEDFSIVLDKLCNGKSVMHKITFAEGLETREIINQLNANKELIGEKIDLPTNSLSVKEGFLLPETYSFKYGTERKVIYQKMQEDLKNFVAEEWPNRDKNLPIQDVNEAIILASIVEKEALHDGDKRIIAGVYYNRLRKKMPLQANPTVYYELTRGHRKFNRPLNLKELATGKSFNTYKRVGLPVTPICNPGKKSIYSVLHPDENDYLFFVGMVNGEDYGKMYYSKTYAEHMKYVNHVKKTSGQAYLT